MESRHLCGGDDDALTTSVPLARMVVIEDRQVRCESCFGEHKKILMTEVVCTSTNRDMRTCTSERSYDGESIEKPTVLFAVGYKEAYANIMLPYWSFERVSSTRHPGISFPHRDLKCLY